MKPLALDTNAYAAFKQGEQGVVAALRRKGKPMSSNDLWIAASALAHGAALLTLDKHFAVIDTLRIGRSLEDFLP